MHNAVCLVIAKEAIAAIVLLSLFASLAASLLSDPFVFQMIPETSPDNPIKSYAANAVMRGSPTGTTWWALIRALNDSGCIEDQQSGPWWYHDPNFWFVSANTYGESSATIGPCYYCVQAWSDLRDQGGELLATSNSVTVHFDFTRQSLTAALSVVSSDGAPGMFEVAAVYAESPDWRGRPVSNSTLASWWDETKLFSFVKCYCIVDASGNYILDAKGNQAFDADSSGYTHSPVPSFAASFSRPGVVYFSIQNMWNGEYGWSWPRQGLGLSSISPQPMTAPWPHGDFQPLALVIPYENGTVVSLPPAFKGPVYKATPIPGDLRLPLLRTALSVFNGSTTHFPLMEEYVTIRDCNHALSLCPSFIELNLPTGLFPMCSHKVATSCPDIMAIPCSPILSSNPRASRSCYRLVRRPGQQWSYENSVFDVSWLVQGGEAVFYGTALDAAVRVLLNDAAAARKNNWQMFSITVVKLNKVPIPQRMTNSYGWTNLEAFGCKTILTNNFSFFLIRPLRCLTYIQAHLTPGLPWKICTIWVSTTCPQPGCLPSPPHSSILLTSPACLRAEWNDPRTPSGRQFYPNKTEPIYSGLKTSIVYSPLGSRGLFDNNGYGSLLRASDASAGVQFIKTLGLEPDAEAVEVLKYQNAVNFWLASAKDGAVVDLAYDGVILQRGMQANSIIVNYTQPDFVIMDYEDFGGREEWIRAVHLSANAEAKRLQGETNLSLAIRLGREFLANHTKSLLQYAPADVVLGVYDLWSTG